MSKTEKKIDLDKIAKGVRLILEGIGEDPEREGLQRTPERVADFYAELTAGMWEDASEHIVPLPRDSHDEMVRRSHRLHSERRANRRAFKARPNRGNFRASSASAGTSDATNRADAFRRASAARRNGCDGSRTYLYDSARRQKTGRENRYVERSGRFPHRRANSRRSEEFDKRLECLSHEQTRKDTNKNTEFSLLFSFRRSLFREFSGLFVAQMFSQLK